MSHRLPTPQTPPYDADLEHKVKKSVGKLSENLHIVANEPSLAFFRLQEHTRKSLPQIVEKKLECKQLQQKLQGRCYDAEYAISAVKSIHNSQRYLNGIQECLKNAMFLKQQLSYEESRRSERRPSSMYQRSSASFDIPSFLPNTLHSLTSAAERFSSSPVSVFAQSGNQRSRLGSVPSALSNVQSVSSRNTSSASPPVSSDGKTSVTSPNPKEYRHSTHGVPCDK